MTTQSALRPFKVIGLHHVAIGHPDLEKLRALWGDMLGLEIGGEYESEAENVRGLLCRLGNAQPPVEIDLLQPLDADKKPAPHLPPLNHIGLWVDHLTQAVEWLTAQGVRFTPGGIRPGAGGREIVFIHPKGNDAFPIGGEGVLIELVQAPPEVLAAFATIAAARSGLGG